MDVLKAESLRSMKWHKAARCARHKMQEVQIIPAPPVSLILVKRPKFSIRSLENASRAYARRRHELCRSLVSSASENGGGQSQPIVVAFESVLLPTEFRAWTASLTNRILRVRIVKGHISKRHGYAR